MTLKKCVGGGKRARCAGQAGRRISPETIMGRGINGKGMIHQIPLPASGPFLGIRPSLVKALLRGIINPSILAGYRCFPPFLAIFPGHNSLYSRRLRDFPPLFVFIFFHPTSTCTRLNRLFPAGNPHKPTYKLLTRKARTGSTRLNPDKTTSVFFTTPGRVAGNVSSQPESVRGMLVRGIIPLTFIPLTISPSLRRGENHLFAFAGKIHRSFAFVRPKSTKLFAIVRQCSPLFAIVHLKFFLRAGFAPAKPPTNPGHRPEIDAFPLNT
jgi:hypothetical protein